jgi:hypothetical protein
MASILKAITDKDVKPSEVMHKIIEERGGIERVGSSGSIPETAVRSIVHVIAQKAKLSTTRMTHWSKFRKSNNWGIKLIGLSET